MNFLELFTYPFALRAIAVGSMISLCAALLGVVLVLKNYSLIGHGLADVGFAAVSLAVALGLAPEQHIFVTFPVVMVASFIIMYVSHRGGAKGDAAIGMAATGALALGVIITALSKGFNADVSNYMFGSILATTVSDVTIGVILSVVVIALFMLLYNRLFIVTFDEDYAKSLGINVVFYSFVISFLTAITVVIGMKMMGTLLISSLIIFPAITAGKLVRSFRALVVAAAIISLICFFFGMIFSFMFNLPTGASIVVTNIVLTAVASLIGKVKGR